MTTPVSWGEYIITIGYADGIPDDDGHTIWCPVELEVAPGILPEELVKDILEFADLDAGDVFELAEEAEEAWIRRWSPITHMVDLCPGLRIGERVIEAHGEGAYVEIEISLVFEPETPFEDVYMAVQRVSSALDHWLPSPTSTGVAAEDDDVDGRDG